MYLTVISVAKVPCQVMDLGTVEKMVADLYWSIGVNLSKGEREMR